MCGVWSGMSNHNARVLSHRPSRLQPGSVTGEKSWSLLIHKPSIARLIRFGCTGFLSRKLHKYANFVSPKKVHTFAVHSGGGGGRR